MNITEGMRRMALVAGALGACAGAAIGYAELQQILAQRDQHESFHSLLSSSTVTKEIKSLNRAAKALPHIPAGGVSGNLARPPLTMGPGDAIPFTQSDVLSTQQYNLLAALAGSSDGWKIDKGGVKAIYFWTSTEERLPDNISAADVEGIGTDDGRILHDTEAPRLWPYLSLSVFPVLGFLLPWGSLKLLTWIAMGFLQSGKRETPQEEK